MEFLLNRQAKFDADMQRMEEAQAKLEKDIDRTAEMVSSLTTLTFEGFKITDTRLQALSESHKELAEAQKALANAQKALAESQSSRMKNCEISSTVRSEKMTMALSIR